MTRTALSAATAFLALASACTTGAIGSITSASPASLSLDTHTTTETTGTFANEGGIVAFTAAGDESQLVISLTLNGKSIEAKGTPDATTFDGHDAVLDDGDKTVLGGLVDAWATRFSEEGTAQDRSLQGLATYLAMAPEGFVQGAVGWPDDEEASPQSIAAAATVKLGNEGVKCLAVGSTVGAVYAGRDGVAISESVVVGSNRPNNYGCMGRCGVDCSGGSLIGYTKDCLDHDSCSDHFKAKGGASNPDCGDEYKAAVDDFLWSFTCH